MTCRICLDETTPLVSVCNCAGSCGSVHVACVQQWIDISRAISCEICCEPYNHNLLVLPPALPQKSSWLLCIITILAAVSHGATVVADLKEAGTVGLYIGVCIYQIVYILLVAGAVKRKLRPNLISLLWVTGVCVSMSVSMVVMSGQFDSRLMYCILIDMISVLCVQVVVCVMSLTAVRCPIGRWL